MAECHHEFRILSSPVKMGIREVLNLCWLLAGKYKLVCLSACVGATGAQKTVLAKSAKKYLIGPISAPKAKDFDNTCRA